MMSCSAEDGLKSLFDKNPLKKLELLLGYKFKHRELLTRAITHKSFANENKMPPEEQIGRAHV